LINRLRALWNNAFRKHQLNHDLDEELRAYVELVSAEKVRSGMSSGEAYRDTRREVCAGRSLWRSNIGEESWLLSGGDRDAGARHRRKCGDLFSC
jgi:hypothetical protein